MIGTGDAYYGRCHWLQAVSWSPLLCNFRSLLSVFTTAVVLLEVQSSYIPHTWLSAYISKATLLPNLPTRPACLLTAQSAHSYCRSTSATVYICDYMALVWRELTPKSKQNGDIWVPANPGPPGKWPLKWKKNGTQYVLSVSFKVGATMILLPGIVPFVL